MRARSTLDWSQSNNISCISLNFGPLHSRSLPYGSVRIRYPLKMRVFGRSNDSIRARPVAQFGVGLCKWISENHRIQCHLLGSVSSDFFSSEPLFMHPCRAFSFALLGCLVICSGFAKLNGDYK